MAPWKASRRRRGGIIVRSLVIGTVGDNAVPNVLFYVGHFRLVS